MNDYSQDFLRKSKERSLKNTWKRMLIKYLLLAAAIYVAILVLLVLFESSIIYPAPKYPTGDWDASRHQASDVEFVSQDGTKLHGWYYEQPQPRGTLLFCHGNGEHVAYNGAFGALLSRELNLNVLVFDFRGYGRSEGNPDKDGILADGEAAIAWLADKNGVGPNQVVVYGRSLGGAIACHLGAMHRVKGVFLQSTFSRMTDVAAGMYPVFPVRQLMRNRYDSVANVKEYKNPLTHIHGDEDRVVPIKFGQLLFAASLSEDKQFVTLEGFGHNDVPDQVTLKHLRPFVDKLFAR